MTPQQRMRLKEEFHAKGFVVIRRFMEESFLQRVEHETMNLAATGREKLGARDIHFAGPRGEFISSMHNLANHLSMYADFMTATELKELASSFFDEPIAPTVFNSSYFAKPAYYGLETKLHQDNAYFHMSPPHVITCWFGLDESKKDNGGLYYYEGSGELGLLPHQTIGELGASQAIADAYVDRVNAFPKRFLNLKRGDVVMHGPLVVHGSLPNRSPRPRRGFNFSFATTACRRDEASHARYLAQLTEFLQRKKP